MYPNKEGDKDKWRHRERREANLLDIDRILRSCGSVAAHHAAFSANAFCKLQLILRRCGSGVADR